MQSAWLLNEVAMTVRACANGFVPQALATRELSNKRILLHRLHLSPNASLHGALSCVCARLFHQGFVLSTAESVLVRAELSPHYHSLTRQPFALEQLH